MYNVIWKSFSLILVAAIVLACGNLGMAEEKYLGPIDVIPAKDGKTLFVVNTDAHTISVVEIPSGKTVKSFPVPIKPTGAILSPKGDILYVTCEAPTGTVCVMKSDSGEITAKIPVGHSAMSPSVSPDGKTLYVCNRFDDDVSVVDLEAGKEIRRVKCNREPCASAITPDGKTVFVSNHISTDPADGFDVASYVTAIDTETYEAVNIRLPNGGVDLRGVCTSPDGKYAFATHILARYQMPTTQLERGWVGTNAVTIIDAKTKKYINSILLDDVDLGAANPWGLKCSADSKYLCVAHAGTHEVSVIDIPGVMEKLSKMPPDEEALAKNKDKYQGTYASRTAKDVPNDLAFLVDLRRRVRLEGGSWRMDPSEEKIKGPRNLAIVGNKAYVGVYFSDLLCVVDLKPTPGAAVGQIALGPAPKWTQQRRGEVLFNDAHICFQYWLSCATCHPDARTDALNWDLMNDDIGNPKNVKSLILAHRTPPAMISGIRANAEIAVRKGITHIQFAVRPEEEAVAIDTYLKSLKPIPSPLLVDGKLSEKAKRGKVVFEKVGCDDCHPAPLFTDKQMYDVGSRAKFDRRDTWDTPTLVEVWRSAPYLHDGRYSTLTDLFAKGKHGEPGELTEKEIEELVEYVGSL